MSKKAFDIFFAVGDPTRRSSLWRAWGTSKGDVCLTTCEVSSDFKLTLHPPSERHPTIRCHLAYRDGESLQAAKTGTHPTLVAEELPEELARAKGDGYGRFDDVWEPREIAPDLTLPFHVLLPDSELRMLRLEVLAGRDVQWLPAPGQGKSIDVALMVAGAKVPKDAVPGSESMGSRLLLRHEFEPTRSLLIVWREYELTPEDQLWVTAYRLNALGPSERVRASFETHDCHRVLVDMREDTHGSRGFVDTAVA